MNPHFALSLTMKCMLYVASISHSDYSALFNEYRMISDFKTFVNP